MARRISIIVFVANLLVVSSASTAALNEGGSTPPLPKLVKTNIATSGSNISIGSIGSLAVVASVNDKRNVCASVKTSTAVRFSLVGVVPGMTAEQVLGAVCSEGPAPVWRPKDWYPGRHEDFCLQCNQDDWWKPVDLLQVYGNPTFESIVRQRKFENWVTGVQDSNPAPSRYREVSPQPLNNIMGEFLARYGTPNFSRGSNFELQLAWVTDDRGKLISANHWTGAGEETRLNGVALLPPRSGFVDSGERERLQRSRLLESEVRATYCLANFSEEFQPYTAVLPYRGLPWLEGEIAKGLRGEQRIPGATNSCGRVLFLRILLDGGYRNGRDTPVPVPDMLPMVGLTADVMAAIELPVPVIGYTAMFYDAGAQSKKRLARAGE